LGDSDYDRNNKYLPISDKIRFRGFNNNRFVYSLYVQKELFARSFDVCIIGHVNLIPLVIPPHFGSSKTKYVLIAYGIDVWNQLPNLQRFGLSYCEQVWAISEYTAERMQNSNGGLNDVRILYNALDPHWEEQAALFNEKNILTSATSQIKSLLTVSRLSKTERDKGHACIINALPIVLEKIPDVVYDIVGSGELIFELQQLARKKGVEDHVRFHGYIEDEKLHGFYKNCDVFVMPSKKEGFGYVYLEAMYYEKPVITGVADAGPEVVRNYRTGLALDPDDEQALSIGIIELLTNDKNKEEMEVQGRLLVSNEYSFNRFQATLHQYLSELVAN
jgi:glycosyltransferase involved in cell wall biosynthesis